MSRFQRPIVVWCGRMSAPEGYGAAARAHVKGMRQMGIPHVAIDTRTMEAFGNYDSARVVVEKAGKLLSVRAVDSTDALVAVVHERPDNYRSVAARGRARMVGYSYCEAATLPASWSTPMISMDEIWTASTQNREAFIDAGVPAWMTHVLHHPIDVDRSISGYERRPSWEDRTVFLTTTSGMHRRDVRVLLEAFAAAFDDDAEVLLVVKTREDERAAVHEAFVETMLANPTRRSGSWPAIELVSADLTREQMLRMHAAADVYVSSERGNGWCLPAVDSMALGVPVVAFDWGGSTEFIQADDCYVVPVGEHLVYGKDSNTGTSVYDDHLWPTVDPLVLAEHLRAVAQDPDRRARGRAASERLLRDMDAGVVTGELDRLISSWGAWHYKSNAPAVVEVAPSGSLQRPSLGPAVGTLAEHRLIGLVNSPSFQKPQTPKDWAAAYKEIGTFTQKNRGRLPEKSPLKRAVGTALATPASRPIRKARAIAKVRAVGRSQAAKVGGAAFPLEVVETMRDYERCLSGKKTAYDLDTAAERRQKVWSRYRGMRSPQADLDRLGELQGRHRGERIFIFGNGPSLNHTDLSLFGDEYTFGVNKIHLLFDRIDWRPTFYTLLDWRMGPAMAEPLGSFDDMIRFYPERFRGMLPVTEQTYWYWPRLMGDTLRGQFATDAVKGIPSRATILMTAIQLAFHLGFRDIVLVGVDASYSIPSTVKQTGPDRFGTGTKLFLESTVDDDPNHFDPTYFGAGARWHDPNVDDMKRMFLLMRKGVERGGGQLRNATTGGNLDVLPRVDLASLFS